MSLRDRCDVAYTMLVERVTASCYLQQQQAMMIVALGGEASAPTLDAELAAFDAALNAEPVEDDPQDVERAELLEALGLSRE